MPEEKRPLTSDDVLNVHQAMSIPSLTLQECGIAPAVWVMRGTCSSHGKIQTFRSTWGGPPEVMNLSCTSCKRDGLKRTVLVEELERLTSPDIPTI